MPFLLLLRSVVRLLSGAVFLMGLTYLLVHYAFAFFCRPQDALGVYVGVQIAFQAALFLLIYSGVIVIHA